MSNIICWICDINLSFQKYNGTKHLDENGNKPCFECLIESGAFEEEETEDNA